MGGENSLGREEEEPQPRQQLDKSSEEDWAWRTVFQKGSSLIPWKVKEEGSAIRLARFNYCKITTQVILYFMYNLVHFWF